MVFFHRANAEINLHKRDYEILDSPTQLQTKKVTDDKEIAKWSLSWEELLEKKGKFPLKATIEDPECTAGGKTKEENFVEI